MIDESRLKIVLAEYKRDFAGVLWEEEQFKWKATKTFDKYWDIKAKDFAGMLSQALDDADNLLAAAFFYPKSMIFKYAEAEPEEVRAMFNDLFSGSADVIARILAFKDAADALQEKHKDMGGQHFQDESTISTYLWLRFPDKYYIYRYGVAKKTAEVLGSDYSIKKGAYAANLRNCHALYDEICAYIRTDEELIDLVHSHLTDDCYPDPEYKTLVSDLGFYINNYYLQKKVREPDDIPQDTIPEPLPAPASAKNSREDFLSEVFMSGERYDMLSFVLKEKKNIILQGAPGVGKTFAAKRLAYSIMGEKDESRIALVQFHQNYSYEDFIMGYKPSGDGFELREGIFYRFCQSAAKQPDKDYFFIIDEINRGNMSRIFGEMLMLIEKDYRGTSAALACNGEPFSVPENLYIIGMMNTADRSLAKIDYALRRRFSFFEMRPEFDSEVFKRDQDKLNDEAFNCLIDKIKELNDEIAGDRSLGKGFAIGHSYFANWKECTPEQLRMVVDFDILPMLEEYWFDDPEKVERWRGILHGDLQ